MPPELLSVSVWLPTAPLPMAYAAALPVLKRRFRIVTPDPKLIVVLLVG